ncbi:hypothetical protein Tco_0606075 [Tanacetum coccineum]
MMPCAAAPLAQNDMHFYTNNANHLTKNAKAPGSSKAGAPVQLHDMVDVEQFSQQAPNKADESQAKLVTR